MKDIKIIIDDKEYIAQVSDEQAENLTKSDHPPTGYERVKCNDIYYVIKDDISEFYEGNMPFDDRMFANGKYVNDRDLCNDRKRAARLHDCMERWQALNDEPVDWNDCGKDKYKIRFDYDCNCLCWTYSARYRDANTIYFSTRKKVEEAIERFRPELMWYYTQYRSRLDAK